MGYAQPVLVIFHGGTGEGPAERVMARARVAAARDSAEAALAAGFEAVETRLERDWAAIHLRRAG
ncbi:MAG: hypothetical protein WHT63_08560 [Tepidiforma sp.]